jgi:hypothetical protein
MSNGHFVTPVGQFLGSDKRTTLDLMTIKTSRKTLAGALTGGHHILLAASRLIRYCGQKTGVQNRWTRAGVPPLPP